MECPNCFFVAAPGEAAVEGPCPQCGERPERDQPSGTSTDFQAFGMPAPGEDDGNQGNPLGVGTIMGKDGERPLLKRDNFMGSVQPPLWYAASELVEDPDIPMDLVEVLEADEVPEKREDRDLDSIEKDAAAFLAPLAPLAGAAARIAAKPVMGAIMRSAVGKGVSNFGKKAVGLLGKYGPALQGAQAVKGLMGDGGGGGGAPQAGPTIRPPSYFSYHRQLAAFGDNNPAGNDRIPVEAEDGDSKQHRDGDRSLGLQVGDDVNDIGGAKGFNPEGEGIKRFIELFPKILEFATSEDAGDGDPDIADLHNLLEQELPGYMDHGDDDEAHHVLVAILGGDEHPEEGHDTPPHDPLSEGEGDEHKTALNQPNLGMQPSPVQRPEDLEEMAQPMQGRCQCGSTIDPSMGMCAQCGAASQAALGGPPQQPIMAARTANQGPVTDEQKAAVAQLLIDQARADEIPTMLTTPEQYADELSEITGSETPPEAPADQAAPTMQQGAPPAPGMPPGMAGPPGGGAGPAPMGMMAAVQKYADDHVREHGDNFDNSLAIDAADQVHQEDHEAEQDSGHTWTDENGEPLKVGQEYEMFSANYDIPDIIRIEAVKPDAIEYTLTGEYGLEHRTEIPWEEAQLENLSFVPASQTHPGGVDQVMDDFSGPRQEDAGRPAPGMNQSDLSNPNTVMASSGREWLKEGGAKFTLMEQREFIEEAGSARNSDKLDLSNTHYESSVGDEVGLDHFLFGL